MPRTLSPKDIFTIPQLTQLIHLTSSHKLGLYLRPLFLLAFFGFLRISNLLPKSAYSYDPHMLLLRQDVQFNPSGGLTLTLKWSKARQSRSQQARVSLPVLPGHPLCPVNALHRLLITTSPPPFAPLFSALSHGAFLPLTQVQARSALAELCAQAGFPYERLGFHAFRRSGVSFLYSQDIPLSHLKNHGTWSSDAIYHYLSNDTASSFIPKAFHRLLLPSNH